MEFRYTPIAGLVVACPRRFIDKRGYFMETYNKSVFDPIIGSVDFVQDNESESNFGVLRGLHLQTGDNAQAKLIRVSLGRVYDVAVDLRSDSETFGQWFGIELSDENGWMLYIPRGFAHGFVVLSETAKFSYKVDNYYNPASEETIAYDDSDIAVKWPDVTQHFVLSDKDLHKSISLKAFIKKYHNK